MPCVEPKSKRGLILLPPAGPLAKPGMPARPLESALAGYLSGNTKRAYERALQDFFGTEDLTTIRMERILAVSVEEATAFRDRLMTEGKKPATVALKLAALRSMYNYLRARGMVEVNPADPKLVRSPKRGNIRKATPLTSEELRRLLAQPDRSTAIGARDYAMILLAAQAGLRREELCTMTDKNFTVYSGRPCVLFMGKGGKERRIPLHSSVIEAIGAWRKFRPAGSATLFTAYGYRGGRLTENSFYVILREYALKAGFEAENRRVHPHGLRATFASILYEDGVDPKEIQELMGHARIETTFGYTREANLIKSRAPDVMAGATSPLSVDSKTAPKAAPSKLRLKPRKA